MKFMAPENHWSSFTVVAPQLKLLLAESFLCLQNTGKLLLLNYRLMDTPMTDTDLTFEQDADDVAKLLNNLKIHSADFLGFSNGAHAVVEIALRHPELINKII